MPVPILRKAQLAFLVLPSYVKEKSRGEKWGKRPCLRWNIMDHTQSMSSCTATHFIKNKHSR